MKIPGYDITVFLGEGRIGAVWKAKHVSLEQTVAIKIVSQPLSEDPKSMAALLASAKKAMRFKHKNLIDIYDVAEQETFPYIVMEYVDEPTLAELVEKQGPFTQKKTLEIAEQIVQALDKAWSSSGIAHGNIHPGNIILASSGQLKLADFGLIYPHDPEPDQDDWQQTFCYMAPERHPDRPPDFKADMFGLGATMHRMLTGNPPFAGLPREEAIEKLRTAGVNMREDNPSISVGLSQMVGKLMNHDPSRRFKSWEDVLKEIARCASGKIVVEKKTANRINLFKHNGGSLPGEGSPSATERPVPAIIQIPAWSLLAAAWIVLACFVIGPGAKPAPATSKVPPGTPAPAGASAADSSEKESSNSGSAGESDRVSDIHAELTADESAEMRKVRDRVTEFLLAGEIKDAVIFVRKTMSSNGSLAMENELRNVEAVIRQVNEIDTKVEEQIKASIGKTVKMTVDGRTCDLIIRSVTAGNVNADLASAGNGAAKRITFTVPGLDPMEKSRLLGPPGTPELAAMRFVLFMHAGNRRAASEQAALTGAFKTSFATAAGPDEGDTAKQQ